MNCRKCSFKSDSRYKLIKHQIEVHNAEYSTQIKEKVRWY